MRFECMACPYRRIDKYAGERMKKKREKKERVQKKGVQR